MLKKENKNLSQLFIVGSFFLLLGFSAICFKLYSDYSNDKRENQAIEEFFKINYQNEEAINQSQVDVQKDNTTDKNYNYIAIIEIPKIKLKRGLFSINDKNNNVDKNIQILKNSDMPNIKNGLLALAGHSGNSKIAHFNNINKLDNGDLVYIYFENIKYIYEVFSTESQIKDGAIEILKSTDATELVLTTCDQHTKGNQIVIMAKLIDEQHY